MLRLDCLDKVSLRYWSVALQILCEENVQNAHPLESARHPPAAAAAPPPFQPAYVPAQSQSSSNTAHGAPIAAANARPALISSLPLHVLQAQLAPQRQGGALQSSRTARRSNDSREKKIPLILSKARHNRYDEVKMILVRVWEWGPPRLTGPVQENGVHPDIEDNAGNTVLLVACQVRSQSAATPDTGRQNGGKKMAKLALRYGANVNHQVRGLRLARRVTPAARTTAANPASTFASRSGTRSLATTSSQRVCEKSESPLTPDAGADDRIRNAFGMTCYEGLAPAEQPLLRSSHTRLLATTSSPIGNLATHRPSANSGLVRPAALLWELLTLAGALGSIGRGAQSGCIPRHASGTGGPGPHIGAATAVLGGSCTATPPTQGGATIAGG